MVAGVLQARFITRLNALLALAIASGVAIYVLWPCYWKTCETASRAADSANLTAIAQAVIMYADDSGGSPPPDLSTLRRLNWLASRELVHSAPGQRCGGSCDYNYVAYTRVQRAKCDRDWPLAYCHRRYHNNEGVSVLSVGGEVRFLGTLDFADAMANFRREYQNKFRVAPTIVPAGEIEDQPASR